MYRTVLFDLDGTLLPMDNDVFVRKYFGLLARRLAPLGYEPKTLSDAIWSGTAAMVRNDGSRSNETVFWQRFAELLGERVLADRPVFDAFYREDFAGAREVCGINPALPPLVHALQARGVCVALATNPIFPAIATQQRIAWAGLKPADFALVTTYENIGVSKPNPAFYTEVLRRLDADPAETLMIGNDVREDGLAAGEAGIRSFLLTDCLINKEGLDLANWPHGDAAALASFLGI